MFIKPHIWLKRLVFGIVEFIRQYYGEIDPSIVKYVNIVGSQLGTEFNTVRYFWFRY